MYVFPHPELPCLNIYFTDEITRRLNKLRDESIDQKESHAIRSITSSADLISWDSQGRVRISDHLLRHLEIKNQLVLVGVMSRIEVWSIEKFDASVPLLSDKAEKIFFSGY